MSAYLSGPLINIDETPFQVLKEPGKTSQSKSYMWIFRGGTLEHPGILFEYHPTRAGDVASVFLKGYKGVVQTDGYAGYAGYGFIDGIKEILHMGCWAHVRRKFLDVVKAILRNSRWSRLKCTHHLRPKPMMPWQERLFTQTAQKKKAAWLWASE